MSTHILVLLIAGCLLVMLRMLSGPRKCVHYDLVLYFWPSCLCPISYRFRYLERHKFTRMDVYPLCCVCWLTQNDAWMYTRHVVHVVTHPIDSKCWKCGKGALMVPICSFNVGGYVSGPTYLLVWMFYFSFFLFLICMQQKCNVVSTF